MIRPVPTNEVADLAANLAARCRTLEPYPQDRFAGDGIVICAGGASVFTNAYVLIHVLRTVFRCTLPIEVWHLGAGEMSARMRLLLLALSAEPVDAEPVMVARGVRLHDGWQLKSFALSESSFARALLLDADIVPEQDPTDLFAWPEFASTGAVLWPDICSIVSDNQIWAACGLVPRTARAVESGQILIDKARHWDVLQIIVHLNLQSEYYYRIVYGDKDLFLMGFFIAGKPFDLVPHTPLTDHPWCLYQRDFAGSRLFQHRTGAKWRFRSPQILVPGFRHLDACENALAALRRDWSGRVFHAPTRSCAAVAEEARLVDVQTVTNVTPGEASETFNLLEGGDIVDRGPLGLVSWYCVGEDALRLVLLDRIDRSMTFERQDVGRWLQVEGDGDAASLLVEGRGRSRDTGPAAPDKLQNLDRSRYLFDDVL